MNCSHPISYALMLSLFLMLQSCGDSDSHSEMKDQAEDSPSHQAFEFESAETAKTPTFLSTHLDGVYFMDHWDHSQEICSAHPGIEKDTLRLPRHCLRKQVEARNFLFWRWKDNDDITQVDLHLILKDKDGKVVFSTDAGDKAHFISPKTYRAIRYQDFSADVALLRLSRELPQKKATQFSMDLPNDEAMIWIGGFGNPKRTKARFKGDMILGAGRKYSSNIDEYGHFAVRVQAVPWVSGSPCVDQTGAIVGMAVGSTHPHGHIACISNHQIRTALKQ